MNVRCIRRARSSRGFTLVELLVSIAIVAILLAIFLPAVQFAREGARNTSCQNNLRQHGLGLWLFDDKQLHMPPLWVNMYDQDGQAVVGDRRPSEIHSLGWRVKLLPYLEQGALFAQFQLGLSAGDPANAEAVSRMIGLFQCPSTLGYGRRFELSGRIFGATDYQAPEYFNEFPGAWATGAGSPNEMVRQWNRAGTPCPRFADIGDGRSHTVQFFEQAGQPDLYARDGAVLEYALPLGGWAMGGGRMLRTVDPSGAINRENGLGVFSFHPRGANFAMCDGSVHFFAEDMDRFALQALFTREQLDNVREP